MSEDSPFQNHSATPPPSVQPRPEKSSAARAERQWTLRAAEDTDLPAILALNQQAKPAVSDLDLPRLQKLAQQSRAVLVADLPESAECGDGAGASSEVRIAGFLILMGPGVDYASLNYRWFSSRYADFLYVDRIVVAEEARGLGLGRLFYEQALEVCSAPVLLCEVNIKPLNQSSLDFHQVMGFTAVGEQDTEGGSKRVRMLARSPDGLQPPP